MFKNTEIERLLLITGLCTGLLCSWGQSRDPQSEFSLFMGFTGCQYFHIREKLGPEYGAPQNEAHYKYGEASYWPHSQYISFKKNHYLKLGFSGISMGILRLLHGELVFTHKSYTYWDQVPVLMDGALLPPR